MRVRLVDSLEPPHFSQRYSTVSGLWKSSMHSSREQELTGSHLDVSGMAKVSSMKRLSVTERALHSEQATLVSRMPSKQLVTIEGTAAGAPSTGLACGAWFWCTSVEVSSERMPSRRIEKNSDPKST